MLSQCPDKRSLSLKPNCVSNFVLVFCLPFYFWESMKYTLFHFQTHRSWHFIFLEKHAMWEVTKGNENYCTTTKRHTSKTPTHIGR